MSAQCYEHQFGYCTNAKTCFNVYIFDQYWPNDMCYYGSFETHCINVFIAVRCTEWLNPLHTVYKAAEAGNMKVNDGEKMRLVRTDYGAAVTRIMHQKSHIPI